VAVYCSLSDLFDFGFPRGSVSNPARIADHALASTNALTIDEHGFETDDPILVRPDASGGVLPVPLAEGVTYYAIPLTQSTFSLAATAGGSAINLTTDGIRVAVIAPLPVDAAIEFASRLIDDMLPAHVVPLSAPVPAIIRMTAGELAAGKLAGRGGYTSKALSDIVAEATKRLARWGQGVPIRGTDAPAAAGLAVTASVPYKDVTGWNTFGGT
jgi:hypothetical protein